MPRPRASLPAPLAQAARRFDRWRARRTTRRIPDELWALAAGLGARHGVSRTARALRVHYRDLRRHMEASQRSTEALPRSVSPFVEIRALEAPPTASCRVELARADGDTLRLDLPAHAAGDVVALARAFLERTR